MWEVVLGVLGVASLVSFVLHRLGEDRELRGLWRRAAEDAGLRLVDESQIWHPIELVCQSGEHRVVIHEFRPSRGEPSTRVVVEGSSGITLDAESLGSALAKSMGAREIELGDEAFDRELFVKGSPDTARAVLDAETRAELRRLLKGWIPLAGNAGLQGLEAHVSLSEGNLQARFHGGSNDKLRVCMAEVLTALLGVARRLEPPADIASRLAENTRTEPEWRVRVQNLILLAESHPEHAGTHAALLGGCLDESDEVRLKAALALKDEGRPTLLEIATQGAAADDCVASAVAGLGEHLPRETAVSILGDALGRKRTETALACLSLLARHGDAAAEAVLLRALEEDLDAVLVVAAAALGRVGSAEAVLPLQEVAARGAPGGSVQRAVRLAVAEIQSRLPGASPGQVSLAQGETGQLSLAEDPAGRVSLGSEDEKPSTGGD